MNEPANETELQTDPGVIMDIISAALMDIHSSPAVLSCVFLRMGVALAVNNKCPATTWDQLKGIISQETERSFDQLVISIEARRAAA